MDLTTPLATGTVAALVPYLAKAGEEFAKEAGKTAAAKFGELYQVLITRFRDEPAAKKALEELKAKPRSKRAQSSLRNQLKTQMKTDPALIDLLQKYLVEIQKDDRASSFINQFYDSPVEKLTQVEGDVGTLNIN